MNFLLTLAAWSGVLWVGCGVVYVLWSLRYLVLTAGLYASAFVFWIWAFDRVLGR